jgi:hypothetical protein
VSGFTVAHTVACHVWPKSTSQWSGNYDRRNQRRCNEQRHCDASAIPGWTMGHYAAADLALRTSRASRPSFKQTGWPACLEGPNLSLAVTPSPTPRGRVGRRFSWCGLAILARQPSDEAVHEEQRQPHLAPANPDCAFGSPMLPLTLRRNRHLGAFRPQR